MEAAEKWALRLSAVSLFVSLHCSLLELPSLPGSLAIPPFAFGRQWMLPWIF